jgi:Flp pilus assembly secretin CpaC
MTGVRRRGRESQKPIHWVAATFLIFGALNAAPTLADQPIVVQLDHARLIELPQRAATAMIGDPLIADLSIQPNGFAVITGRGYGMTNVIVLDREGAVLAEETIEVTAPGGPVVAV